MTEIVTVNEFLMLYGAAGGRQIVLPDFGSGFIPPKKLHQAQSPTEKLEDAHRILAGLLKRELLEVQDGRAVLSPLVRDYFETLKNAAGMLCSWPGEGAFPKLYGYLGNAVCNADMPVNLDIPVNLDRPVALLGNVIAQPGALRLELVTIKVLAERFMEWLFDSTLENADQGVAGAFKERAFDGYFAAPAFLMALPKTRWILDVCPSGCVNPTEHVKRRLLLEKGGVYPMIYQEGERERLSVADPATFYKYFVRLLR